MPESTTDYVYVKNNNNICSGYFCSYIFLPNKDYSSNITTHKGKYLKQIFNQNSKYNNKYVSRMHEKCEDIVNKFFNVKINGCENKSKK